MSVDQLIDRVWADHPPLRVRSSLHSYLTGLRRALASAPVSITGRSGTYVLTVDEDTIDLHRFRHLIGRARAEADDERALVLAEQALGLWRGEPFAGLDTPWLATVRAGLERERAAARLDHIDVALRCSQHTQLLPELSTMAGENPLDERVAGQLMLALYRAGRQADALAHYQHTRQHLAEELGTDPGPELQQLHRRILAADSSLAAPSGGAAEPVVVPRQLPAAPPHFTGRDADLAALTATLDQAEQGRTVVISAIGGAGGIGKTWLALHWAHRQLGQFPDGQLFVDLRGFSPTERPMPPAVAVRGFLDALGVDPARMPAELDAQAALYRGLVAGRRMLIVLDNAATAEQVAPLLPGGRSCTVLVTSRRTLTGLITRHGAGHLGLDVLTDAEARALLHHRLGAARLASEPEAVAALLGWCRGFPLALGLLAGRAHTNPDLPLAQLAAEVRESGVDALDDDDPTASLPAVLATSQQALPAEQQQVFGLLGIAPGPDISLPAAASLTGLPQAHTARLLRALQEASLLHRDPHGRYAMHDLIRSHAASTAARDVPAELRDAALARVVDFYLHTAHTADRLLSPQRAPIRLAPPAPGCHPHSLSDVSAALAWFDTEHACLLATQHTAALHHWHHAVWQLAWALNTFHPLRGHRRDLLALWRAGLAAAEHLHDPAAQAMAHRYLGNAYAYLRRHDEAIRHLHQALSLAEHHHDLTNQAHTHRALAWAWEQRGDDQQALEHATHALNLYRTLGLPIWEAGALNAVGWFTARLGNHDQAREHCQAALTLFRCHPDRDGEAASWDSLGYIDHHTGRDAQAIRHYRQALTLRRDLGDNYQVADVLDGLGHPHAALGQHDQARAVWREAHELYRDQGRDEDAARVQRQLDNLDQPVADQPNPGTDSNLTGR